MPGLACRKPHDAILLFDDSQTSESTKCTAMPRQNSSPSTNHIDHHEDPCTTMPSMDQQEIHGTKVVVIIPAHEHFGDIIACINSLQAERQQLRLEFLVIWDGDPHAPCLAQLRRMEAEKRISLIVSQSTLGFCNAVNRGLILAQDHDVIVVRDDIRVHSDWADRLHRAACNSATVGTVTPFSNHAYFCGYPKPDAANALPHNLSYEELDDLTRSANTALTHGIPSADGPVFYLTSACIKQIGLFDNARFRDEDTAILDFCIRASNRGFTHLLCADLFIYRISSPSSPRVATLADMPTWAQLTVIYPGPAAAIQHFVAHDPLRPLRRHIDIARLATSPKPHLLFVTHRLGGGTEKHIQDLSRILEDRVQILILRPAGPFRLSIEWARAEEDFKIFFELPFSYPNLVLFLRHLNVFRIHYHHLIELSQQIFDLPKDLNISYDFTLHDYYSICPQYTLTTKNGEYCGEPPPSICNTCLQERPAPWGLDIDSWRALFQRFLASADRVFAPSRDTLDRIKSYISDANYVYLPHPEFNAQPFFVPIPTRTGRLKILILGRLSLWKGIKKLEECALDAYHRSLPIFFRVIGTAAEEVHPNTSSHLSFYGEYNDGDIPNIISLERPDAFLFIALWPESYSYTLSHALRTGFPIIAPDIGAFPERLREHPSSTLVPWDISPPDLNDLLLSLLPLRDVRFPNSFQNERLQPAFLAPEQFCLRYLKYVPPQTTTVDPDKASHRSLLFDHSYYPDDASSKNHIFFLDRDQLLTTLRHLSDILNAPDTSLDSLLNLAREMTTLVQEQKADLDAIRQELRDRDEQLNSLSGENDELNRRISTLTKDYESEIRRLNHLVLEKSSESLTLYRELVFARTVVSEMQKSTSWRLTAPLRAFRLTVNRAITVFPALASFLAKRDRDTQTSRLGVHNSIRTEHFFSTHNPPSCVDEGLQKKKGLLLEDRQISLLWDAASFPNNFNPSERFAYSSVPFRPRVTVIVPNYNHGRFLRQRLDSIYNQTYRNFDVILLDDCSSDESREILKDYGTTYNGNTRLYFNDNNSGLVFGQWKKGIEMADGDLVWIAESDDFCETTFLEKDRTIFCRRSHSVGLCAFGIC